MNALMSRHTRRSVGALFLAAAIGHRLGAAGAQEQPGGINPADVGWPHSLLRRTPDVVDHASGSGIIATFADFDRYIEAAGLERPPAHTPDWELPAWLEKLGGLALPVDLSTLASPGEFRALSGFGPDAISQTVDIGDPPLKTVLYQGSFDRDALLALWASLGYQEIEAGDAAIWSLSEDESFDGANPVQALFNALHNNAALIGDDLVVFASRLDLVRSAVAAATGAAPSLADNPAVSPFLAVTPRLATGVIVPGKELQWSRAPSGEKLPPVELAMVGQTAGGPVPGGDPDAAAYPEQARIEISLQVGSDDAAREAIGIAGVRLETFESVLFQRPYSELFASWSLSAPVNSGVARLSLKLAGGFPNLWAQLLFSSDLGFVGH